MQLAIEVPFPGVYGSNAGVDDRLKRATFIPCFPEGDSVARSQVHNSSNAVTSPRGIKSKSFATSGRKLLSDYGRF